jgi:hypothetical protein
LLQLQLLLQPQPQPELLPQQQQIRTMMIMSHRQELFSKHMEKFTSLLRKRRARRTGRASVVLNYLMRRKMKAKLDPLNFPLL